MISELRLHAREHLQKTLKEGPAPGIWGLPYEAEVACASVLAGIDRRSVILMDS